MNSWRISHRDLGLINVNLKAFVERFEVSFIYIRHSGNAMFLYRCDIVEKFSQVHLAFENHLNFLLNSGVK